MCIQRSSFWRSRISPLPTWQISSHYKIPKSPLPEPIIHMWFVTVNPWTNQRTRKLLNCKPSGWRYFVLKNTTQRVSRACDRAPTLLKAMGKEPCPSKIHFARCVTQVEGRPDKVTWKCDHCGKHVISGAFRAANARIHLAAEKTNGVCSILCDSTDDHAEGRNL